MFVCMCVHIYIDTHTRAHACMFLCVYIYVPEAASLLVQLEVCGTFRVFKHFR